MTVDLLAQLEQAKKKKGIYQKFLSKLVKKTPKNLDVLAQNAHQEVFSQLDCLSCANCCKTTSPIFRMVDIERLAKHLRIKPAQLIAQHLHIDNDGDYVLNSSPCTFLGDDNKCLVYEFRPTACREYPHTDRKNFHQITQLTLTNSQMCPATARVLDKLMDKMP